MKQVIIIIDNGYNLYVERFDLNKISLDEMKELFGEFVRSKGSFKAVKCPVCGGKGKIVKGTAFTTGGVVENSEVCHGCNGKGWVEVSSL